MKRQVYLSDTTNGKRVAIAIAASGKPCELIFVDLEGAFRHSAAYRKLNPTGRIPTLVEEELVLTQTFGILLHLGLDAPTLLPQAPLARAETLDWLAFQMTDLTTMGMAQFHLRNRLEPPQPSAADQLKDKAASFYELLEERLKNRRFVMGESPGIVDIAMWPMLAEFEHVRVAQSASNLARWRNDFEQWQPTKDGLAEIRKAKQSKNGTATI